MIVFSYRLHPFLLRPDNPFLVKITRKVPPIYVEGAAVKKLCGGVCIACDIAERNYRSCFHGKRKSGFPFIWVCGAAGFTVLVDADGKVLRILSGDKVASVNGGKYHFLGYERVWFFFPVIAVEKGIADSCVQGFLQVGIRDIQRRVGDGDVYAHPLILIGIQIAHCM